MVEPIQWSQNRYHPPYWNDADRMTTATEVLPVVALDNVSVSFHGEFATNSLVSDVSFHIQPGEILGVVGESGAGKSMVGAAIAGLLEPPLALTGGQIRCGGRRIDNLPPEAMRKVRGKEIATIFQDPLTALNPVFSIGRQLIETIVEHADLRGANARRDAIDLLAQVGVPSAEQRLSSFPHEFSGGMRQRVVIALALAGRPKLIIADEPTTALDVSIQGQIITLLRELCLKRGTAIMLVTHDMGVIAEAAQRVVVMYAGRIVEVGPVEQVIRRPKHPYTAGLMNSIPKIGERVRRLPQIAGAMPRPQDVPEGCSFAARCTHVISDCTRQRPELVGASSHQAACWLATAMVEARS